MFCVISPKPPNGSWASITVLEDGMLKFESLYDPALVRDLKRQIPSDDWRPVYANGKFSYWAVASYHARLLADLAEAHGMGRPQVPQIDVVEDDPWDAVYKEEDAHDNDYMGRYPIDSDDLP